jgi:cysteine synthase A
MIANSILEIIGNTPLIKLHKVTGDAKGIVLVKLESANPGGSVKDRMASAMICSAEESGELGKDTVIIEPTSGNTGIGLAMIAAAKGYRLILTMPETMSIERRKILSAYGAELKLSPATEGMKGAIALAEKLVRDTPNSFMPFQFSNKANPEIHRRTTAVEIWKDTRGEVDAFVAGVGTGGTITGVSEELKKKNPSLVSVAVEPLDSPVLSGGKAGPHKIQGIGAGFIPEVLNTKIYEEIIMVATPDAYEMARRLAKEEGILCGISSGANVFAAVQLAKRPEFSGKTIVTIICDTGERYLSTELFQKAPALQDPVHS